MDHDLRRLIRKNNKIREYLDGWNIDPEEFNIFEIVPDPLPVIEVKPISSERFHMNKKEKREWK